MMRFLTSAALLLAAGLLHAAEPKDKPELQEIRCTFMDSEIGAEFYSSCYRLRHAITKIVPAWYKERFPSPGYIDYAMVAWNDEEAKAYHYAVRAVRVGYDSMFNRFSRVDEGKANGTLAHSEELWGMTPKFDEAVLDATRRLFDEMVKRGLDKPFTLDR